MTETSIQVIAALGLFSLGLVIGVLVQRSTKGDGRKIARLQAKLNETEERFTRYQADVTAHFMDTARKVQTLNKSYKDVHEQLASGARKLCEDDEIESVLSLSFNASKAPSHRGHTIDLANNDVTPPMDYAPKDKPEEEGTLSEGYGFEGQQNAPNEFNEDLEQQYKGEEQKRPTSDA